MYKQGYLGVSEFKLTNQNIELYAQLKFDNMSSSMKQANNQFMSDIAVKDENGSVLKYTRQMSSEIEKTAFLVVENIQNTYAKMFYTKQNNQNYN
jgi:hypothetical protein